MLTPINTNVNLTSLIFQTFFTAKTHLSSLKQPNVNASQGHHTDYTLHHYRHIDAKLNSITNLEASSKTKQFDNNMHRYKQAP